MPSSRFPDFVVLHKTGMQVGYKVRVVLDARMAMVPRVVRDLPFRGYYAGLRRGI